jgi:hypothetical protein
MEAVQSVVGIGKEETLVERSSKIRRKVEGCRSSEEVVGPEERKAGNRKS